LADPDRAAHALTELARAGVMTTEFALGQPSLDEVFLALTGRPAETTSEPDTHQTGGAHGDEVAP
jgi:ABC-2 type transport system ATP-binding protein